MRSFLAQAARVWKAPPPLTLSPDRLCHGNGGALFFVDG